MSATLTAKEIDRSYQYDTALDEDEALERYAKEKAQNPGAIVTIEELHCGEHYRVKVFKTEREKGTFYQMTLREMFSNLWDAFKT
jgi:hypothetical protein